MSENYPFFRDEDEQTQAVIGEEAVSADLDGSYQKPYAVLTQKRLYVKNEMGNFITEIDQLSGAGIKKASCAFDWLLWIAAGIMLYALFYSIRHFYDTPYIAILIVLVSLALFILARWIRPKLAPIFLCIYPIFQIWICCQVYCQYGLPLKFFLQFLLMMCGVEIFLPVVLVIIYYVLTRQSGGAQFEIRHTAGSFPFPAKLYTAGEFKAFTAQLKKLKEGKLDG